MSYTSWCLFNPWIKLDCATFELENFNKKVRFHFSCTSLLSSFFYCMVLLHYNCQYSISCVLWSEHPGFFLIYLFIFFSLRTEDLNVEELKLVKSHTWATKSEITFFFIGLNRITLLCPFFSKDSLQISQDFLLHFRYRLYLLSLS
jgi:hypothetical protein